MEKMCVYCAEMMCSLSKNNSEAGSCILNVIIYQNSQKILLYNLSDKKIFKISKKDGLREMDFKEAIREIDTIPEKEPNWKRLQILTLAKELGIFG